MENLRQFVAFLNRNLMFFSMLALVMISTSALALTSKDRVVVIKKPVEQKADLPRLPLLSAGVGFPVISAQAALAVDLDSGVSLYEKNPSEKFLPASTTKIVTALVSLDYYSLSDVLTVVNPAVEGRKMGLAIGETMTAGDLLKGLLIYSANDAAEVLAQNYPGGREAFVVAMNQKALDLGLTNSYFTNPAGLDGGTYTTARDLLIVAEVAMKNPIFSEIVKQTEGVAVGNNGKSVHRLATTNDLLGNVDGVMGVKTGWTENARENLITYIERDGKRVMIVALSSQDRFGETKELIDWIFGSYSWGMVNI